MVIIISFSAFLGLDLKCFDLKSVRRLLRKEFYFAFERH